MGRLRLVFDVLVFRMVWLIECDFLNSPYGVLSIFHKKMVLAALTAWVTSAKNFQEVS